MEESNQVNVLTPNPGASSVINDYKHGKVYVLHSGGSKLSGTKRCGILVAGVENEKMSGWRSITVINT